MESASSATKVTKRSCRKKNRRGSRRLTVDDLTNLNWVSGTPVPMDPSVSHQVAQKKIANSVTPPESNLSKIVLKKKLFKTPLPTYKIVLRDQKDQLDQSVGSSDCSSPEKEDNSVIFANVISENPSECNDSVDFDLLVDTMISSEDLDPKEPCVTVTTTEKEVSLDESLDELKSHIKPNCSYTCLIGMAMKASTGCLPVNAIYQYIEYVY